MGYLMMKSGQDYLILEGAEKAGVFFDTEPRHRTLISINKRFNPFPEHEYNMRHDWNSLLCDDTDLLFRNYSEELFPSADDFVRYIADFVKKYDLNIHYKSRVINIDREGTDGKFVLKTKAGRQYTCDRLLLATGAIGERLPTHIPGIELCDTYATHDIDPEKYTGKTVCILGRGNSAFEVSNHLAANAAIIHVFGEKKLKFAWDTHFVGDLRAVNNTVLDMYQLKSLHAYQAYKLTKVKQGPNNKLHVQIEDLVAHWNPPGRVKLTVPYDHVIICTGWNYCDQSIFCQKIEPETKRGGKYPKLTSGWETNVKDMFYIGTAMQSIDRQAASGFIHGFRYNVRTMYHILLHRYHQVPYPAIELHMNLDSISESIIDRVSTAASIYQMNDFLCDVLVLPDAGTGDNGKLYLELPKNYVLENEAFMKEKNVFIIVLQYGFHRFGEIGDHPNNFVHIPDFALSQCGPFLHPNLAYYKDGVLTEECDLLESLLLRFDGKEFLEENGDKQRNAIKNFVNKHMKLSPGETFDDSFLDKETFKKVFKPLTDEEIKNLSKDFNHLGQCKPMTIDMKDTMHTSLGGPMAST
ncbi:FAD-dependent oxidoreductase domain-containing protein 2-like [Glandiceps talaboti]